MAGVLQHLRSSTLNKRPNPSSMVDGQVAINYASGAPGMFFKDSNGALVKVGPVHVGSGAPNAVPASGGTAGNSLGEQWLDTSGGTYVFKIWDGSAWRSEAGEFVNVTGDTMTGALGIIAGSASSPSLFFSGDTNTGIYSPGADQLAISSNSSERIRIGANGEIGLSGANYGTSGQVLTSAGSGAAPTWTTPSAGNTDKIEEGNSSAEVIDTGSDGRFVVTTEGSERLRVDSSGRLGLGTSSPSSPLTVQTSGATLAIRPLLRLENTVSGGIGGIGVGGSIDFYDEHADGLLVESARICSEVTDAAGTSRAADLAFYTTSSNSGASSLATEKVRIQGDGKVGIGTTSPSAPLHINGTANNTAITLSVGGTVTGYIGPAGFLGGSDSSMGYRAETGNNHAFFIGASEAARIDSSRRLLVGTSSGLGDARLQVVGNTGGDPGRIDIRRNADNPTSGSEIGTIRFSDLNGASGQYALIQCFADAASTSSGDLPGRLTFSTTADGASSPTERAKIDNKGFFKATSTGSYYGSTSTYHEIRSNSTEPALLISNHAASGNQFGLYIALANDQNNTSQYFLTCVGGGTERATVRSNGGLANYSANNVNLSDVNVKKDIALAADTWDCLKEWEIVNFRYKDQPDNADLNMGVIAQQVAESCPEVITVFQEAKEATETEPAQEERLGVKEQQMMWMAIKALQEAQLRIETLEAEVAALKGA
jgi:hypothetical protein